MCWTRSRVSVFPRNALTARVGLVGAWPVYRINLTISYTIIGAAGNIPHFMCRVVVVVCGLWCLYSLDGFWGG